MNAAVMSRIAPATKSARRRHESSSCAVTAAGTLDSSLVFAPPRVDGGGHTPAPKRSSRRGFRFLSGFLSLLQWDAALVTPQPLRECLQSWIEAASHLWVPRSAEFFLEVPLELEHVADVFCAGEAEAAEHLGGHGVVAHLLLQRPGEVCRHFGAGQVLTGDADALADLGRTLAENPVRALADVLDGDARELLVSHRQGDHQPALTPFGSHPELDEVLPIEGGEQERGRHTELGEDLVGFSLGVEVRHLVLAHQRRHALVLERYPAPRVLEGGPDHVPHACVL